MIFDRGLDRGRWLVFTLLFGLWHAELATGQVFGSVTPEGCSQKGAVADAIDPAASFVQAGGQQGDIALAWRRLSSPPANPEPASGPIDSIFDWLWLGIEQAPRGPLEIDIERAGVPMTLRLQPGLWDEMFTPRLPPRSHELWHRDWSTFELEEARDALDHMLRDVRQNGDWCIEVWVLLNRALILANRGMIEDTVFDLRRAIGLARAPFAKSMGWVALASHERNIAKLGTAVDSYRKAHQARVEHGGERSLGAAEILAGIATISDLTNAPDDNAELLEQVLALQQDLAPGSLVVADTMTNLAAMQWDGGQAGEARAVLEKALRITERLAPGSLGHAAGLTSLATIARDEGDIDSAVSMVGTAIEIYQRSELASVEWVTSLNLSGILYSDLGRLDAALSAYTEALDLMRMVGFSGPSEVALLANIGTLYSDLKDLQQARRYFHRALALAESMDLNRVYVAGLRKNLSHCLAEEGRYAEAESELIRALDVFRESETGNSSEAMALVSLGLLYEEWKTDWGRAEALYRESITIMDELAPNSQHAAYAQYALGRLALMNRDLELAVKHARRALDIRRRIIPDAGETAETLHLMAEVERAKSSPDLERARGWLREALDILESQLVVLGGTTRDRTVFREQMRSIYQAAVDVELELGHADEGFAILDGSRARAFLERFTIRKLGFLNALPEDLAQESKWLSIERDRLHHELVTLDPGASAAVVERLHDQLEESKVDARALSARIERVSPKLAALRFPKTRTIDALHRELDPGTLVLSYSVGDDVTTLFVLFRSSLAVHRIDLGRDTMHGEVRALREAIDAARHPRSSWAESQRRLADQLGGELIGPVAHALGGIERAIVLADGPLHFLPWAALRLDGHYLAERIPVVQAGSLTAFVESVRARPDTVRHQRWEGFGDVVYPKEAGAVRSATPTWHQLKRLPATRRELETIANEVEPMPVGLHLGAEATEERFRAVAEKATILHLAAHGFVDPGDPLDSFIAFSVPETFDEDGDNGLLHAWEIFEHLRLDAELVVLSACGTALGSDEGGEGLAGLARAFRYAGARSVVGSLWQVDDDSTAELMAHLYRQLARGASKDEALVEAQRALIRSDDPKLRMPYYWSAFQLYGDWR